MHQLITSIYTYSVLQYRHSQILGEVLNVGLLVYLPEYKQLEFIYPKKLSRITTVYPQVQEKSIRHYLRSFAAKVDNLNKVQSVFANDQLDISFVQFISENLLPPDSSALQFDEPKRGLLKSDFLKKNDDIKSITRKLYELYFSVYDSDLIESTKTDEIQLLTTYRNFIKDKEKELGIQFNKIIYDYEVKTKYGEIFKFDIAWKNGSTNLVKPVSFDLTRPNDVQNKALRYYGQFVHLDKQAELNNLRFDVLLAKPKNKDLFSQYDSAIKLLEEPKRVRLVFEEEIYKYSEKTILAVTSDN